MDIKRVIVDKKPTDCIACALSNLKICGEDYSEHKTSGAVYMGRRPDSRCKLRVGKR